MLHFKHLFGSWNQVGSFSSWDIDVMHTDNVNQVSYFTFVLYDTPDAPVQRTVRKDLM